VIEKLEHGLTGREPPGSRRALTLIELIIVIAIIALLVALLLPCLRSTRDQTQRIGCQSNQRQILVAMQMYSADYRDEWFTFNHEYDFEHGAYTGITYEASVPVRWEQIVNGNSVVALAMKPGSYRPEHDHHPASAEPSAYVPNWGVLTCPATANRVTRPEHLNDIVADRWVRNDDRRQAGHSYSYLNGFEVGDFARRLRPGLDDEGQYDRCPRDGLPDCLKIPRAIVGRMSNVILLADGDNRVAGSRDELDVFNCPDSSSDNHGPAGWNVGFADGHVSWLDQLETFWALYASDMIGHWTPGQSWPDQWPKIGD
jgi:prepilin-type N-terminal cleavage/methylation domain-containing protein/prepilin-type processing-associated H-X9-DG protein